MSDQMTPEAQIAMLEAKVTELVERNRKLANQIVGYGDRVQTTIAGIVKDAKVEALREAVSVVMGDSEYLMDGATCRMIAQTLRTRADNLEAS